MDTIIDGVPHRSCKACGKLKPLIKFPLTVKRRSRYKTCEDCAAVLYPGRL